jgi:putative cell wall-binding protein
MTGGFLLARARGVATVATVGALLLSTIVVPPAAAEHYESVREIDASSPIDAAVEYSQLAFPDGTDEALLGRVDVFADSLASGTLQRTRPLLLTSSSSLSSTASNELRRLSVDKVIILGGLAAISRRVEDTLRSEGYTVQRVWGATRIETAVAVAEAAGGTGGKALLARSTASGEETAAFADSLAAGGWSAATGWPVLLTESSKLTKSTGDYLARNVDEVIALGGQSALSDAVLAQVEALGVRTRRVAGATRFETAVEIAKARGYANAAAADGIILVDGQGDRAWTDGFAAAAHSGRGNAPIILANSAASALPAPTATYVAGAADTPLVVGWTTPLAQGDHAAEQMGKVPASTRTFTVPLSWRNVTSSGGAGDAVWGHGERDKSGSVTLRADEDAKTLEYTLNTNATAPFRAQSGTSDGGFLLRKGPVNSIGAVVARFDNPDAAGNASGELKESALLGGVKIADLISRPKEYYLEVNTTAKPNGAVRGQLPAGAIDHLPDDPSFLGITSTEGDSVLTLKFNVPVFAPGGLTVDHFSAKANDGVSSQVVEITGVATSAAAATDTFKVRIAHEAEKAKKQELTLLAPGTQKLKNLAGVTLPNSSATKTHVTPEDTIGPRFVSLEARNNSDLVHLNFSEPVHTQPSATGTEENMAESGHLTITVTPVGGTAAAATVQAKAIKRVDRTARVQLQLGQPVPPGASVKAEFSATTTRVRDSVYKILEGDRVRTTTAVSAVAFTDLATSDLVVARTSTNATAGQTQTLAFRLADALPATARLTITLPGASDGVSYSAASATLSGGPASAALSDGIVTVTPAASVAGGTLLTITLSGVSATGTAPTTSPVALTIRRSDTGGTATGSFHLRPGIAPDSMTVATLDSGQAAALQAFQFHLAGALPANGTIRVELANLDSAGGNYVTQNSSIQNLSVTPSATLSAAWVTSGGPTIVLTAGSGGLDSNTLVSFNLAGTSASFVEPVSATVPIRRSEATAIPGMATGAIRAALADVSADDMCPCSPATQTISFTLGGTMRGAQGSVGVRVALPALVKYANGTANPTTGPGTASVVTSGQQQFLEYYLPDSGEVANATAIVISLSGIDARYAPKSRSLGFTRVDSAGYSRTVAITVGTDDIVLTAASLSGDSDFGDDAGDKLTLTYSAPIETSGSPEVNFGPNSTKKITCNQTISCTVRSAPENQIIDITAQVPMTTPVSGVRCDEVKTVSGVVATTSGLTVGVPEPGIEVDPGPGCSTDTARIRDMRAQDNGLPSGTVDGGASGGDVHQFIFSKAVASTIDDLGSWYRLSDDDGTVANVECGKHATCVLQPAEGSLVANQAMRVRIRAALVPDQPGTVPGIQYPARLTAVSATHWQDSSGAAIDRGSSADTTLNVDTISPAPTTAQPEFAPAPSAPQASAGSDTIAVSMKDGKWVSCTNSGLTQWKYSDDNDTNVNPVAISCSQGGVLLTFSDGAIVAGDGNATITYDDDAHTVVDNDDVVDRDGNQLKETATEGRAVTIT